MSLNSGRALIGMQRIALFGAAIFLSATNDNHPFREALS